MSADTVAQALQRQDFSRKRLGTILIESGAIDEMQLASAIAHQAGLPVVDLVESEPSRAAAATVDGRTARDLRAIPLRVDGSILDVAVSNGLPNTREQLERASRKTVRLYVAPEAQIETLLAVMYPTSEVRHEATDHSDVVLPTEDFVEEARDDGSSVVGTEPTAPTATVSDGMGSRSTPEVEGEHHHVLDSAPATSVSGWGDLLTGADDPFATLLQLTLATDVETVGLDMLPAGTRLRFQFRKADRESLTLAQDVGLRIVERAHAAVGCDTASPNVPVTGQFEPEGDPQGTLIRVDSLPTMLGVSLTLRILRDFDDLRELQDLGLRPDILEKVLSAITSSDGLIILAGQSGSGRSTTLQAIVREALRHDRRALLLEAEQRQLVVGASQVRLDGEAPHLTIRAARSLDADLIAVDGINDSQSARQALEGALDGNLIFASLNARSAADAIEQLVWLASEPTKVSGAVRLVLAQTAVDARCSECHELTGYPKLSETASLATPATVSGNACHSCVESTNRERVIVFEALEPTQRMTQEFSELATNQPKEAFHHVTDGEQEPARRVPWKLI